MRQKVWGFFFLNHCFGGFSSFCIKLPGCHCSCNDLYAPHGGVTAHVSPCIVLLKPLHCSKREYKHKECILKSCVCACVHLCVHAFAEGNPTVTDCKMLNLCCHITYFKQLTFLSAFAVLSYWPDTQRGDIWTFYVAINYTSRQYLMLKSIWIQLMVIWLFWFYFEKTDFWNQNQKCLRTSNLSTKGCRVQDLR